MPFTYVRDDVRRLITVTALDSATVEDIIGHIDRQIAEGTWSYAMLYDGTRAPHLPAVEEIERAIVHLREAARRLGRRGPLAIVTTSPETFGLAREYSRVEPGVGSIGFFRDRASAEEWLNGIARGTDTAS